MINLPKRWEETIRVSPSTKTLYLHFKNDANQYYTYYQILDPAFSINEILLEIPARTEHGRAYQLDQNLQTVPQEPQDQNWTPAPLPFPDIISMAQYEKKQVGD